MISKIKGQVKELNSNKVVIETPAGLFFEVFISPKIADSLELESFVELEVLLVVTEKFFGFYGFETREEKEVFSRIEKIPGIGHKLAYNIISFAQLEKIAQKCKEGDIDFFVQIPGVGRKTAKKLIIELGNIFEEEIKVQNLFVNEEDRLLIEALKTLGYKLSEIKEIIPKVERGLSLEERLKKALKFLSKA